VSGRKGVLAPFDATVDAGSAQGQDPRCGRRRAQLADLIHARPAVSHPYSSVVHWLAGMVAFSIVCLLFVPISKALEDF
jgi:hypothetical protein